MEIIPYLKRFKAENYQAVSLEQLNSLQSLHLENIPFENLDVIRKTPIYLNTEKIYKKIVKQQRGGFCYELNGLLQYFLEELGYDSYLAGATVLRKTKKWAKNHSHAVIIVNLEQPYLVDVGFGSATPKLPIPFSGEHISIGKNIYWLSPVENNKFDLFREKNNERRVLYRITFEKMRLIDFHEGIVFNQVSKDSTFTHHDIISIATSTGQITLNDTNLKIYNNNIFKEKSINENEKTSIYKHYFNIVL